MRIFLVLVCLATAITIAAQPKPESGAAPSVTANPAETAALTALLKQFLAGASQNDAAMHDRFWADDLIYTSSSGRRLGKADIMREVRQEGPPKPDDGETTFTAEDIRIHQYGSTAIVAFRLVGTTKKKDKTDTAYYMNTGTFLKRNDQWRAIAWQATVLPPETKK